MDQSLLPEQNQLKYLQNNPVVFLNQFLGVDLWDKQKDIANAIVNNKTVAVRSCHGSGKTFLAARLALWWLFTRPYSAVLTTAPSNRQVVELLWKEIRVAYNNAKISLGGTLLPKAPKLQVADDWVCIGFSTDDPVNFQGWHSRGGTLIIFDEAPGVHSTIWDAVGGVLVSNEDRLLCIGNPVEPSGKFFDLFKSSFVKKIHISAYDTPNVVHGENKIKGLCSKEWVDEKKISWGEQSPLWHSRVLGNFPATGDNVLVPLPWLEAANERYFKFADEGLFSHSAAHLGVDVARLGSDFSMLAEYVEDVGIRCLTQLKKQDTMTTVGDIVHVVTTRNIASVNVDQDGLGAGVFDRLLEVFNEGFEIFNAKFGRDDAVTNALSTSMGYEGVKHEVQKSSFSQTDVTTQAVSSPSTSTGYEHVKQNFEISENARSAQESGMTTQVPDSSGISRSYGDFSVNAARHKSAMTTQVPRSAGIPGGYGTSCSVVRGISGGTRPKISDRFFNLRAEAYWNLREALDPTNPKAIALPINDRLLNQLSSIKWKLNSKGKIQIESKEDMRKRGMQSPDEADAVIYAMMGQHHHVDFVLV